MTRRLQLKLMSWAIGSLTLVPAMNAAAQEHHMSSAATLNIPRSIKQEHEAIHNALIEATQQPGQVGTSAKALAAVLHPHFVREEQIALPPLGLLAPLLAGEKPTDAAQALAMTDSLKSELPAMLVEHKRIRAAVADLRAAARAAGAAKYERLADQLALHALTEEEVLYPAAALVGDLIRARSHHCHVKH
jgi:iron-sulfur cluster repair protein YtfE (RIC family)